MDGWVDKYEAAAAGGVNRPGWDEAVISDADILHAVETLRSEEGATSEPVVN